jgi:hypothetical protein
MEMPERQTTRPTMQGRSAPEIQMYPECHGLSPDLTKEHGYTREVVHRLSTRFFGGVGE